MILTISDTARMGISFLLKEEQAPAMAMLEQLAADSSLQNEGIWAGRTNAANRLAGVVRDQFDLFCMHREGDSFEVLYSVNESQDELVVWDIRRPTVASVLVGKDDDMVDLVIITSQSHIRAASLSRKSAGDLIKWWFFARETLRQTDPRFDIQKAQDCLRNWEWTTFSGCDAVGNSNWAMSCGKGGIVGMYVLEKDQERIEQEIRRRYLKDMQKEDEWRDEDEDSDEQKK